MPAEETNNNIWDTGRNSFVIEATIVDLEYDQRFILPLNYISSFQFETDVNEYILHAGIILDNSALNLLESINSSGNTIIKLSLSETTTGEPLKTALKSIELDFIINKHEIIEATNTGSLVRLSLVCTDFLAFDNFVTYSTHSATDSEGEKKVSLIKSLFNKSGLSISQEDETSDESTLRYITSNIHSLKDSVSHILGTLVSKNFGYYNIKFDPILNTYILHSPKFLKEAIVNSPSLFDNLNEFNYLYLTDSNTGGPLEIQDVERQTILSYSEEDINSSIGVLNRLKTINARTYNHRKRKWDVETYDSKWIHSALPKAASVDYTNSIATKSQSSLIDTYTKNTNNQKDIIPRQTFELYDSVKNLHELTKIAKVRVMGNLERKAGDFLIIDTKKGAESADGKKGLYYILKVIKILSSDEFVDILYLAKMDNYTGYTN